MLALRQTSDSCFPPEKKKKLGQIDGSRRGDTLLSRYRYLTDRSFSSLSRWNEQEVRFVQTKQWGHGSRERLVSINL